MGKNRQSVPVGNAILTADLKLDVRSPTMEVRGTTIGNLGILSRFTADR